MAPEANFARKDTSGSDNTTPAPRVSSNLKYETIVFDNENYIQALPDAIREGKEGIVLASIQRELDERKLVSDLFAWNIFLERLKTYCVELKEKSKNDIVHDIVFPIGAHIAGGDGALIIRKGESNPGIKISSRAELRSFDWYREHSSDYRLISHELSPEAISLIHDQLLEIAPGVSYEKEVGDVDTTTHGGEVFAFGGDRKNNIVLSKEYLKALIAQL